MTTWIVRASRSDERLLVALLLLRRPRLDAAMSRLTRAADPPVAVVLGLLLAFAPLPALAPIGARCLFALIASHLLVQVLKRSIGRPRPRLPVGLLTLCEPPDRFSFPSGHAAAAFSLALPLVFALPVPAGAAVLLLAALVGVSRCYLGVHYPGDVAAGALAAAAAVAVADPVLSLVA